MRDRGENVKKLAYEGDAAHALQATLSHERFRTYLTASDGDIECAIRLYTWNTAVSAAFYGPLQALEIAVRNAMQFELAVKYGENWYDNADTGLDRRALQQIERTKADLVRKRYDVDPPHVIAGLSFGFWVTLLSRGGRLQSGRRANYDMTLWRPALYKAFPHAKSLSRSGAHKPLDYLRTFRNRIAHHEPVFQRHLDKDYQSILDVMAWVSPEKKAWVEAHCRVPEILATPKDDPDIRF